MKRTLFRGVIILLSLFLLTSCNEEVKYNNNKEMERMESEEMKRIVNEVSEGIENEMNHFVDEYADKWEHEEWLSLYTTMGEKNAEYEENIKIVQDRLSKYAKNSALTHLSDIYLFSYFCLCDSFIYPFFNFYSVRESTEQISDNQFKYTHSLIMQYEGPTRGTPGGTYEMYFEREGDVWKVAQYDYFEGSEKDINLTKEELATYFDIHIEDINEKFIQGEKYLEVPGFGIEGEALLFNVKDGSELSLSEF